MLEIAAPLGLPTWAKTKDPDSEGVIHNAFLDGQCVELQRQLTVKDQELSVEALSSSMQYFEATHHEGGWKAIRSGSPHNPSKVN